MEIWLDTIHYETIELGASLGWVSGVTTNPAILSSAPQIDETLFTLLDLQNETVAVQVTARSSEEMIEEGKRLFSISDRFMIKVPVNREGLRAIYALNREGIPTLGTAIFTSRQALLAAQAGADYVAPYFSHMAKEGIDVFNAIQAMQELFDVQMIETKIMAASLKTLDEVMRSAQIGVAAATLTAELFAAYIADDPSSEEATRQLHLKWEHSFKNSSIADLATSQLVSGCGSCGCSIDE